ncbi:hypothetical protein [Streptomyces sp. NPDC059411]|uniref:hypothetical protein n=1 Tax=Streptomyces sp. NPDC059411 TaxID=3346825 RepID=UPI00367EDE2D
MAEIVDGAGTGGAGSGTGGGGVGGGGREGAGGGGSLACPRCGREDRVRGVAAAYLRAKAELKEETGSGEDAKTTTRQENSALSKALSVAPTEPDSNMGCWGAVLLLVAVGSFVWGAIEGKWFDTETAVRFVPGTASDGSSLGVTSGAYLGWISGIALVIGVLLMALSGRALRAWRRRTEPGRAAADRVWSEAWYCGRCGTVHFSGERAMSLQEFRVRVWSAGGYGDLAVRHPAI